MDAHEPNPVDLHVGRRIRLRRRELGLSQERLADGLMLTFQQIQKYERGANRVSASKLFEIASLLGVSTGYFYDGLNDAPALAGLDGVSNWNALADALLAQPNGRQFAEAFLAIRCKRVRKGLVDLACALADAHPAAVDGGPPALAIKDRLN